MNAKGHTNRYHSYYPPRGARGWSAARLTEVERTAAHMLYARAMTGTQGAVSYDATKRSRQQHACPLVL